jgi:hypothetical protein
MQPVSSKPNRTRLFAPVLAAVICAAGAQAQSPGLDGAAILWAGIYRAEVVGFTPQPRTATGKTNQLANIEKLETTTTVRARLGVSFGFEFKLEGAADLAQAPVTMVVVLPKAGLRNPDTQKHITREEWQPSLKRAGDVMFVGYSLEHTWEVVPGLWKFEIWQNERKLGEQSFCVVRERAPPDPGSRSATDDGPCPSVPTA